MKILRLTLFLACIGLISAGVLLAQEHKPAEPSHPAQAHEPEDPNEAADQALAHASNTAGEGEAHEAGGEHDKFKYSPTVRKLANLLHVDYKLAYWMFLIINFAIVFGAIFWVSKSRVPAAFRARTASIQKGLEEARKASEDANRRLSDVESRLQRLDSEIASMKAQAESDGLAEEGRIRTATEQDARKVVELAEQEIASAGNSARRELKAYAAELAVAIAEKKVHLDRQTDEALVRNFVSGLGKDGQ
jgi:F-type H+-transporting ATPase subunit b